VIPAQKKFNHSVWTRIINSTILEGLNPTKENDFFVLTATAITIRINKIKIRKYRRNELCYEQLVCFYK